MPKEPEGLLLNLEPIDCAASSIIGILNFFEISVIFSYYTFYQLDELA